MTQIADSAGHPAGKVIKTLSNIRFIRSTATSRPDGETQDTLTRETPKQPSEAYVPPEPPKSKPKPTARRGRRHRVDPDPVTEELIRWFGDNRDGLPTEPYRLTAWQNIINPTRFYEALSRDIDAYPDGPRSHVIGEDLRSLRERFPP
ncbi:MAG: hypothetical protein KJ626_10065 [Verrucomicrobia bacterium]|nr:hypothetical protein [Verrucomicrobiota bacterium]